MYMYPCNFLLGVLKILPNSFCSEWLGLVVECVTTICLVSPILYAPHMTLSPQAHTRADWITVFLPGCTVRTRAAIGEEPVWGQWANLERFIQRQKYRDDSPPPPPQGIFDILAELFPKPKALVLDWSYNITHLFNSFANMLAHPLQRPVQDLMAHRLNQTKHNSSTYV